MLMESRGKIALAFVLFAVFIDTLGFMIVMPVLPEYLSTLTGESVSDAAFISGLIMATFAIAQFLCGPLMGNLSDRFGRRPILLVSMIGFSINYFMMAFAPNLAWLFVGRALAGVTGAIFAPANAYIADITKPEHRARGFALIGAASGFGFIGGPAVGGLIGVLGPRAPFLVAGALALANAIFGSIVLRESLPHELRRPFSFKRANPFDLLVHMDAFRGARSILVCIFFFVLGLLVFPSTLPFFAKLRFGWSTATIGGVLAYAGLVMAAVQLFLVGRVVKALGERRAAMLGGFAVAISMYAFAFVHQEWLAIAIMTVGCIQAVALPSLNAMASQRTSQEAQGALQGSIASITGLAEVIGPLFFGFLLSWAASPSRAHPFDGAAFLAAAVIGTFALILVWRQKP